MINEKYLPRAHVHLLEGAEHEHLVVNALLGHRHPQQVRELSLPRHQDGALGRLLRENSLLVGKVGAIVHRQL